MPTEQEYQDYYDEGFEEGRKQLKEYIEQVIDELNGQEVVNLYDTMPKGKFTRLDVIKKLLREKLT